MASVIGTFALVLALLVAVYGAAVSFAGARSRNALMVESGRTSARRAAHRPRRYRGFMGMTVPVAFARAARLTGRLSGEWIRITRRWTLFAWVCLTAGLFLGSLWSYSVLGWGGYWAWDPVENIAVLPWLASTAFLHSVMVQERRGMLKVWNLS